MLQSLSRRTAWLSTLAVAALLAGSAPRAEEQETEPGQSATPERLQSMTTDGSWHGTWTYVNRNEKMVLWIDESEGTPRIRVQYLSLVSPEAFVTDWDGAATYGLGGETATFHMAITEADADRISGTWLWDVQFSRAGRSESGVFTLYRVGDGRQALIDFSEYDKVIRRNDKSSTYSGPSSWSFRKVSKRHALWQEIF